MRYDWNTELPIRAFHKVGGRMTLEGGGKGGDSPPPPDYGPLARASVESAQIMAGVAREQMALSASENAKNRTALQPVLDAQLGIMNQTRDQGADYFQYMKENFRPAEQKAVKQAMEFNDASYAANMANQASANMAAAQANQKAQTERAMSAMGVNPNSGRFASGARGSELAAAAMRGKASTDTFRASKDMGFAKLLDISGMGRGLPGASQGAYQTALSAGAGATSTQMAPSALYQQGMAQGGALMGQGLGMQMQGLTSIAGMQGNDYRAALASNAQSDAGFGQMVGALGAAAINVWSSKKLKEKRKAIDGESVLEKVETLPVEEWNYKKELGIDEGQRHIGPYAEDVHQQFGDKAAPEGQKLDIVTMNGINLAATKELAKKVRALESRLEGVA